LIEVLVAIVILAIGLLGLAALQSNGLRGSQESYLRTQATLLASDITDRMRANRLAALNGDYDAAYGAVIAGTTIAAQDLIDWTGTVGGVLPLGQGQICRSNTGVNCTGSGNVFVIAIRWDGGSAQRDGDATNDTALIVRSEL
jgi:type IV pilus assembly protein PilV